VQPRRQDTDQLLMLARWDGWVELLVPGGMVELADDGSMHWVDPPGRRGSKRYFVLPTIYLVTPSNCHYHAFMTAERDDALTSEFTDSLVQLSFAVHDVLGRASAEHDLSVTQLRLLGMLRDRTPPMTAIAEHLGLDRSSVTGLVTRAERRGLVTRTTSRHDARVTVVSATPRAFAVGRQVASRVTSEIEAMVAHLPQAERDCLARAATSVLGAPRPGSPSPVAGPAA
jgi:DNA-binding MarR family transcriptional regulator